MLNILVWTLAVLCSFCLADGDVGHRIFPPSPIIERGSTLQLFCSLGRKLYPYKNASDIIWTLNGDSIAKENYIIINDTVSGVIIHNFTYGEAHVKCYVDFPVEKQHLAHTEAKSGFPPQRPENISCIIYKGKGITCSWALERDTYIETDYTIIMKRDPKLNSFLFNHTWRSKNGSRSPYFQTGAFHPEFCIQLKLENPLGKAESQCVLQKPQDILMLQPTPVKVETIPGRKKMLRVSWKRNMKENTCRIRYRNMKQNDSKEAYKFKEVSKQNSSDLVNLRSSTEYAVAIQCIPNGSRFWSEWSSEEIGATEEEAPSKEVDLWRVLEKCQPTGSRQVRLLWKQLTGDESSGTIKGYRIKCFTRSSHPLVCANYTTDMSFTVQLMEHAYVVSVIAHNSAGDSPEAVLKIPSCAEESKDHPRVVMLNASAVNEQMVVEWETSDPDIHNYVVEWYDLSDTDPYERSWQYVRNTTRWTFNKGAFRQYRCYNILVYPVYKDEIKAPRSIQTYFKQGRPSDGPIAEVGNAEVGKNEATIKWKEIEKGKANGDIINYTIFYRPEGGKEIGVTVNASLLQYRLQHLQTNAKYTAHVMASTNAGGTNGTAVIFSTKQLSPVEMVLIKVFVGLFILCLLTFGILWAVKRRMLKRIFWPKVPHPKLPEMSQDNLEKSLKEPQSEENTVIPEVISILKVDENDKGQLLELEDCLGQTEGMTEDPLCPHEASGRGGHEAIQLLLQTVPSLGQPFTSQLLPAPMSPQLALQKSEENFSGDYWNSSCKDEEGRDPTNTKAETEFNPYLRNSVPTREFLVCENPSARKEGRETILAPCCVSSGSVQQYVALEEVLLAEH
ncbi:interleukin-31 receptor subunit alpha [Paroedura picta]|uniref:interleukin-31 receptor subunit alpha n=1 Tax=Paroedura picta TaxID=143630 RepID=UPI004055C992